MILAEPVNAKVFIYHNGQWKKPGNRVTIPAGYYIIYDDKQVDTESN